MTSYRVSAIAGQRLDEIHQYSSRQWDEEKADSYIRDLFQCFDRIARRRAPWRAIPAEFGVEGFYGKCRQHFIYWRLLSDGDIGIVTVLHERMHQFDRFKDDIIPTTDRRR